jgi:hypothetical protein
VTGAVIQAKDFGSIVISSIPDLTAEMENSTDFVHLQMHEFRQYALRQAKLGNDDGLRRCVEVLERVFRLGDSDLKTAVSVAFLEHIDASSKAGKKMLSVLTPELRQGWTEMQVYARGSDSKQVP